VGKLSLPNGQYIDQAERWSKELTRMRSRGAGDIENAMRGIEREYGVEYTTIWSLRYRKDRIKKIGVGFYERLRAAYALECDRQLRKLRQEIAITHPDHVAEAQALVDQESHKNKG